MADHTWPPGLAHPDRQHRRVDGHRKRRYPSQAKARKAAARMTARHGRQFTAYQCPARSCSQAGWWHIGTDHTEDHR